MNSSHLKAGNYLTVYVKGAKKTEVKTAAIKTEKNSQGIALAESKQPTQKVTVDASKDKSSSNTNGQNSRIVYHIVQPGDTLWDIAKRYNGVTVQQIKDVNRLNSNNLRVGTKLKVLING